MGFARKRSSEPAGSARVVGHEVAHFLRRHAGETQARNRSPLTPPIDVRHDTCKIHKRTHRRGRYIESLPKRDERHERVRYLVGDVVVTEEMSGRMKTGVIRVALEHLVQGFTLHAVRRAVPVQYRPTDGKPKGMADCDLLRVDL